MIDLELLKNPPAVYRAAPFWSWNDDLEVKELCRQIDLMKEGGWGGYFMHARVGLITPYLGEKWMECIKACVEHSRKTGTIAYLYDEDKWPSGFAGGMIPKQSEEYHVRGIGLLLDGTTEPTDKVLATYNLSFEKDGTIKCEESPDGNAKVVEWKALWNDPWFNDTCYVDLMNPNTTRAFLQSTHERYAEAIGESFSKEILGMFTDEPSVKWPRHDRPCSTHWTPKMPTEFKRRRGYDLLPNLMSLFLPVGNYKKVRYDFYRTALELFVKNYSKIYYDWCQKHKLPLVGHYMAEDNIEYQIYFVVASMPHYEYMHVPGMDHLSRNIDNPLTAKQVSSVANQFGRERAMSETYGCSGQNMSFEDRKWIWDWHIALGINLENPHLWLYTMRGERKRDFPPTISHQQPYWEDNKIIADYSARLCYCMSQGSEVSDLLLIHPVESGWMVYEPESPVPERIAGAECKKLTQDFAALIDKLLSSQITFDLGDESIMSRHASLKYGKLRVGRCTYNAVALPGLLTLRRSTLELLLNYQDVGGTVFLLGMPPSAVDGADCVAQAERLQCPEDHSLLDKLISRAISISPNQNLMDAMGDILQPLVRIPPNQAGAEKIFTTRRAKRGKELLFFANTDKEKSCKLWVEINSSNRIQRINLENGEIENIHSIRSNGAQMVELYFPPAGSHLLRLAKRGIKTAKRYSVRDEKPTVLDITGHDDWELEICNSNALTLDYCVVTSAGENAPKWVLDAETQIKALPEGTRFEIKYTFHVSERPESANLGLVVERLTPNHKLFVNDVDITGKSEGIYFNDVHFLRYGIDSAVLEGTNTVTLTGLSSKEIAKDPVIEAVYVVGNFGVFRDDSSVFTIKSLPKTARVHNLVEQGLPFFPGKIKLRKTFDDAPKASELRLEGVDATVVKAYLNGVYLGAKAWRPFDYPIPEGTLKESNTLELVLTNTLRNLLGPHHHKAGELLSVSPGSFRDKANWTDEYSFVPLGVKKVKLC